jgi:hypothetical protein
MQQQQQSQDQAAQDAYRHACCVFRLNSWHCSAGVAASGLVLYTPGGSRTMEITITTILMYEPILVTAV